MSIVNKSPKATTIAIYSLGLLLGALHIFLGVVALTPLISNDYHREVKINYSAYAKTLLSLYEFTDKVTAAYYLRMLMSVAQVVFGSALAENGHFLQLDKYGNYGLLVVNAMMVCFQLSVGTAYERLAPSLVFSILLVARLFLVEQGSSKARPRQSNRPQRKVSPKKKD